MNLDFQRRKDGKMLTRKILEDMPSHTMFATGTALDTEGGLFMANTGKLLRWVAVRGEIQDWAVYAHFAHNDEQWVRSYGDKVGMEKHIKMCVPCDEEAYALYRL